MPADATLRSTTRLPLFPLRTVLFPGGMLPLRVFEQRYIAMTKRCIADDAPFGVCLITEGDEVARRPGDTPSFSPVGTLARIVDWDAPELGILHLSTIGGARFTVEHHEVESSGLVVADVAPLAPEPAVAVDETWQPLARLLELVATRVGPQNFPSELRYDDASWVGYRLAELLPLPLSIKQSMLEINDAGVRLSVLRRFLADRGLL